MRETKLQPDMRQYRVPFIFVTLMALVFTAFLSVLLKYPQGAQWEVFFQKGNDLFADFFNVCVYVNMWNPYDCLLEHMAERAYPPLAYLIIYCFSGPVVAGTETMRFITVFLYTFISSLALFCAVATLKTGPVALRLCTAAAVFMSGIFLYSFERGNIIMLAAVGLVFFLANHENENRLFRHLAYIALAAAAAIKIYPAIFGLLLIYQKRYKDAVTLVGYGLAFFFLPFLFFNGGFDNIALLIRNIGLSTERYRYIAFSRFGLAYAIQGMGGNVAFVSVMEAVTVALSAATLAVARFLKGVWRRCAALACVLVLLPVNSAMYAGLYFFPVIALFLNEADWSAADIGYMLLFVLFLNPFRGGVVLYYLSNWCIIALWLLLVVQGVVAAIKFASENRPRKVGVVK